jgi:hypothetical protein
MNTALYQVMPALALILARPVAPSRLRLEAPAADEDAEFSEVHEPSAEDEDD